MIKLSYQKSTETTHPVLDQTPLDYIKRLWLGEEEAFNAWIKKHNLQWNYTGNSIEELCKITDEYIRKFAAATKKDFSCFDPRILDAFLYLPKTKVACFAKNVLEYSGESNESKAIIEGVASNLFTRSFCNYIEKEDDKISVYYYRVGLVLNTKKNIYCLKDSEKCTYSLAKSRYTS